jgi:hypothetical protein
MDDTVENRQGQGLMSPKVIDSQLPKRPKIADRKQDGIPGHEPNLWIWYRVPGIPDFTPIFDLLRREERILSTILGRDCQLPVFV